MSEIILPEASLVPVAIEAEKRVTLGNTTEALAPESDRISVGKPVCRRLEAEDLDRDGQSYLSAHPKRSFWLLTVSCSFRVEPRAPLERAWVEVELETLHPIGRSKPTARSMEPLSGSNVVQAAQKAHVDGALKLKSPLVPLEVGSSASVEESRSGEARVPFMEAHREGTSRPCWFFHRTEMTEIRGVHRLRLIIEAETDCVAQARLSIGAVIRVKRLRGVRFNALLEQLPEHEILRFGDLDTSTADR